MSLFELAAKIVLDDSDYSRKIKRANESGKQLGKGFVQISEKSQAAKNKIKVLSAQYDSASKTVKRLTTEFNASVKANGAASNEAAELARKLDSAESEANGLRNKLDELSGSSGNLSEKLSGGIKKIGRFAAVAGTALGTAAAAMGKIGMSYNAQMESYTTNFKVMLGSTEASVEKVEELKEMAAKTPFGMSELADATQTLLSFQVPAEKSTDILRMLGDVALGDKEKMKGLALVFGQVSSAGKLQGQDLLQLINQGFNPLNYISERTGETMEQLRERMSAGAISAQEVEQAFEDATSAGGQFHNGMEEASGTMEGLLSTLEDTVNSKLGEFFEDASGEASDALPDIIEFVENIDTEEVLDKLGKLKNTFVAITPAIAAATAATVAYKAAVSISKIIDLVRKATEKQTIAQAALNAVMAANPFVLIATLLAAVGTALVTLYATNEDFRAKVNDAWDSVKEKISGVVGKIKIFFTETIPETVSDAIEALKKIPKKMKTIGKDLLEGLWNGISDKIEWLKGKVAGVVDKIKSWFTKKESFDIHSPSRWFKSIGEYMMAGLAIGMEDGAGGVLETVDDIITEIKRRFQTIGGALQKRQSVTDLEQELWERTEGKDAGVIERFGHAIKSLTKRYNDQKSVVDAADAAYKRVAGQYGKNNDKSLEFQETLLQEKLGLQDIQDEIDETVGGLLDLSKAKDRFKDGTTKISFKQSGVGKSSEQIVNANLRIADANTSESDRIRLVLTSDDGDRLGSWLVPFTRKLNKSNPEVVSDPV